MPAAAVSCKELVHCGCKKSSKRCKCIKVGLSCTPLCVCVTDNAFVNKLVVVRKYANVKKNFRIEATHKTVYFDVLYHLPCSKPVDRTQRLFGIFDKRGIFIFVAMTTPN